ncbi:MAG: transposase [Arenimonas sp.]|nr:transposase [Arenimonas sp.]
MPRKTRLDVPRIAQHIIQRGNDRKPCFFGADDCRHYLGALREMALRHDCAIHAYVLMTNHVHLLATPQSAGAVGRMMQGIGRNYVRYLNDRLCRTGTLWEGRYKACLVDSDRYALACIRYIELNPVRAGMVAAPVEYPWSSCAAHALGRSNELLSAHPSLEALGVSAAGRQAAYRQLLDLPLSADVLARIRVYARRQRALGSPQFQQAIEDQFGRPAGLGRPGRPRRVAVRQEKVL